METHSATARNVRANCELEEKALARRTVSARIGDIIATQAGRMWFIVLHIVWFAVWLAWNINPHGKRTFDPFPFALMTMIVSLESMTKTTARSWMATRLRIMKLLNLMRLSLCPLRRRVGVVLIVNEDISLVSWAALIQSRLPGVLAVSSC